MEKVLSKCKAGLLNRKWKNVIFTAKRPEIPKPLSLLSVHIKQR